MSEFPRCISESISRCASECSALNGLPLMANVVSWLLSSLHLVASSLAVKSNIYKLLNGLSLMMKALSRLLKGILTINGTSKLFSGPPTLAVFRKRDSEQNNPKIQDRCLKYVSRIGFDLDMSLTLTLV